MLIISQDKEVVINFDNITGVQIRNKGIEAHLINGDSLYIGEYNTQERAKEVLEEITNMYKATESFIATANRISDNVGALAIQKGFAYYMPQE